MIKIIMFVLLALGGILFIIDPFGWWPMLPIDHPCEPLSQLPRCTGKINFF